MAFKDRIVLFILRLLYSKPAVRRTANDQWKVLIHAEQDEPVFLIRGKDELSIRTITDWMNMYSREAPITTVQKMALKTKKLKDAHEHTVYMSWWQREHPEKVRMPD